MSRKRRKGQWKLLLLGLTLGLIVGAVFVYSRIRPMPAGKAYYVRISAATNLDDLLSRLQANGTIRDAKIAGYALKATGSPATLRIGTYGFKKGMTLRELRRAVAGPISRMVRLREMRWIARTGQRLASEGVCSATAYKDAANHAEHFHAEFPFVPASGSLEGYLTPDTYDLPPLTPAEDVVRAQLRNFQKKVQPELEGVADPERILTIASLVEMEASDPDDRRMISGVIRNRIKKKMRLQIDATVLYGRQRWGRLFFKDYTGVKSPYNTYLIKGLPPGPICSPTRDAVNAALNPSAHNAVYYVALADGTTVYADTYEQHKANIELRKKSLRQNSSGAAKPK